MSGLRPCAPIVVWTPGRHAAVAPHDAVASRRSGAASPQRCPRLAVPLPSSFRNRARALPVLAVLAVLAAPGALGAQRATLEPITHHETLANGLQVIVVENHAVPLATAEIVVRTGAMTQAEDEQGVPHLYEHMLFKSYHGAGDRSFGQEAAMMHAAYNGTTSEEQVSYFLTLPSSNVDDAVRLLADLVRDPRFEDHELQTERFVVFGEFQRRMSEPPFQLQRGLDMLLWGPSFNRKNTIGNEMSLLGVTPKRLEEIYHRYYVPNNAALVVTGDVSAAPVFAMAHHRFDGWKQRPDPFAANPVPPMAPLDSSRALVVAADVNDITIEVEWQGPSVPDDARGTYAADVLSDIVDDEDSDFQKRLVDSGLFHSAHFSYETLAHVGPITFRGTTTPDRLAGALTSLATELALMNEPAYFTPQALAVAKKRRSVQTVFELEEGATLAQTLGDWWSVGGLEHYLGYVDNLSACTAADLHAYVQRYLGSKPFVVGALAPAKYTPAVSQVLAQYIALTNEK